VHSWMHIKQPVFSAQQPFVGKARVQDVALLIALGHSGRVGYWEERMYWQMETLDPEHIARVLVGEEQPLTTPPADRARMGG
jgi:hypothetical protein